VVFKRSYRCHVVNGTSVVCLLFRFLRLRFLAGLSSACSASGGGPSRLRRDVGRAGDENAGVERLLSNTAEDGLSATVIDLMSPILTCSTCTR
jgi:hypothetical protein